MRSAFLTIGVFWSLAVVVLGASRQTASSAVPSASGPLQHELAVNYRGLVDKYCVTCHNQRAQQAGLMLDRVSIEHLAQNAATWEKVVKKLRTGAMPPVGMPRPDEATMNSFVAWLEKSLDREAATTPNPGRPSVHRLNRTEYANAIRDLLGLEVDVSTLLPPDTTGFGFDNVADVLSVSPGLLERYLAAARKISRLAVGDPTVRPDVQRYTLPFMILVQDKRMNDDLPFGSRGGTAIRHYFPVDGDYVLKIVMQRSYLNMDPRGLATAEQVDVRLDGERLALLPIGGLETLGGASTGSSATSQFAAASPDADLQVRLRVKAGLHTIGVTFRQRTWAPEGIGPSSFPPASFGTQAGKATSVQFGRVEMGVDSVRIEGPFQATLPETTDSRRRIFVCRPNDRTKEETCARTILATLTRRAYRGGATAGDVERVMEFFSAGRAEGAFEIGIQRALERILVSPHFIFRVESDPPAVKPGTVYRISDLELASRLSFFLWSSIPDDELLQLAASRRLRNPAVMEQQIRRMLVDPRSNALTRNFFGQWLYVRNMRSHRPDQKAYMEFDENLREAFMKETELFADHQIRDDRSVTELLSANYTFVNERLARHYGIPNVYGPRYRRVTLPDVRRAGILGHGSLLTVTSMSTRTSPVKRGAWLLEHLLGTPPPPPPPSVPPLEEKGEGKQIVTSVRQRMEQHRRNAQCAACHAKMDPLGFALENFDGVGQWRDNDGENLVDASGTLPDGTKFNGPADFRNALLRRPEVFVGTVTEKLMTYALGRGVEHFDIPAVRKIVRDAASNDYRWSSLIIGIVRSMPFQMRRASEP